VKYRTVAVVMDTIIASDATVDHAAPVAPYFGIRIR